MLLSLQKKEAKDYFVFILEKRMYHLHSIYINALHPLTKFLFDPLQRISISDATLSEFPLKSDYQIVYSVWNE